MIGIKCLQPFEEMARISRVDLGNRLDEILDIVTKDDVGYVITDEGKKDLVLCPAEWFEGIYDDDFACIIHSALRYAIRRETYMPSVIRGFIRRHMSALDARTIAIMIDDIERDAEKNSPNKQAEWLKLRDDLVARFDALHPKDACTEENK